MFVMAFFDIGINKYVKFKNMFVTTFCREVF